MPQLATRHAHEAFCKRLPYELSPSNLPGAYISPAPSKDLDFNSVDTRTLVKHGLLWRRPTAKDRPTLHAAWKQLCSRKWQAKNRLIPTMDVQFGKSHQIKSLKKDNTGYINSSWSGGVLQGDTGSFTSAIGFWVIPSVAIPDLPQGLAGGGWNSSSWVGIDGFHTSNDVLQAGIEQAVDAAGNANYQAWFEWWKPDGDSSQFPYIHQTNISNFPVAPGQTIWCSVQYVGNNTAGYLYLANGSTGDHFSITLIPPTGADFSGRSAEWILEAPGDGEPTTSLPSLTPVQFTTAFACNSAGQNSLNPLNGDYVNIVDPDTGQPLTEVVLDDDAVNIYFIG